MTDTTLNCFLASGGNADRLAFTPDPPTPASGPDPTYIWFETDTLDTYAWDFGGAAWKRIGSKESLILSASDESTALAVGTGKLTFRMPYAFTVAEVRASLTVAQTSGTTLKVDVNEAGTTILSTKLTFDNGQKSTGSAAQSGVTITTAAVISDGALADNAEITIDIDAVGDGTAKGLKVMLIGRRT